MTELKTLNDIGNLSKEELRSIAIKWIKYLINCAYNSDGETIMDNTEVVMFIKHFFNITEDDLK